MFDHLKIFSGKGGKGKGFSFIQKREDPTNQEKGYKTSVTTGEAFGVMILMCMSSFQHDPSRREGRRARGIG